MRCCTLAIVGEYGRKIQHAAGAEAPDTEADIGDYGRGGLIRLGVEVEYEKVYGFDDRNRYSDDEIQRECCEKEKTGRHRYAAVLSERSVSVLMVMIVVARHSARLTRHGTPESCNLPRRP